MKHFLTFQILTPSPLHLTAPTHTPVLGTNIPGKHLESDSGSFLELEKVDKVCPLGPPYRVSFVTNKRVLSTYCLYMYTYVSTRVTFQRTGVRVKKKPHPTIHFRDPEGKGGGIPTTTGCRRHDVLPRSPRSCTPTVRTICG